MKETKAKKPKPNKQWQSFQKFVKKNPIGVGIVFALVLAILYLALFAKPRSAEQAKVEENMEQTISELASRYSIGRKDLKSKWANQREAAEKLFSSLTHFQKRHTIDAAVQLLPGDFAISFADLLSAPDMLALFGTTATEFGDDEFLDNPTHLWGLLDAVLSGNSHRIALAEPRAAWEKTVNTMDFWSNMKIFSEEDRRDISRRSWENLRPLMLTRFFHVFAKHMGEMLNTKELKFPPEPPKEPEWSEDEKAADVAHLNDSTFDTELSKKSKAIVMFYAPWCGHCNKFKPDYAAAATALKDHEVLLGAVDSIKSKKVSRRYGVTGYPTIIYFENGQNVSLFDGERTAQGVVSFLNAEQRFNGALTELAESLREPTWGDDPEAADVIHSTDESFDNDVKSKKHALVMFYAPWCGHCTKFKPDFQKAATTLKGQDVALVGIDATKAKKQAEKYEIKGFPTLKYFVDGELVEDYEKGERTAQGIYDFFSDPSRLGPSLKEHLDL